ncbi:MAG TPA: CBS domain-containing protein [Gemmatimonadales bacterium]|nr:CBS domain-containing protein [Gemmatimonadales bacterium]
MSTSPLVVDRDLPVGELIGFMQAHKVSACPVVEEGGRLFGIVSRLDLLRTLRPTPEHPPMNPERFRQLTVRDVARYGVVTVTPADPLGLAADRFLETRLHVLPVVESGDTGPVVVGIISQGDVLRRLLRPDP